MSYRKVLHVYSLRFYPGYEESITELIRPFFDDYYTIMFDNYAVADRYLHRHEVIPTGANRG